MPQPCTATICILALGDNWPTFHECFWSVLEQAPRGSFELRMAFGLSADSFEYALGTLNPAGNWPERYELPGGVERFGLVAFASPPASAPKGKNKSGVIAPHSKESGVMAPHSKEGMTVWLWNVARNATREQLVKLMLHDVRVAGEYLICLDQAARLEAGWWERLTPMMEQRIDLIGESGWQRLTAAEAERIEGQPWYMGVPYLRREGKAGIAYMEGDCFAVRAERLHEVEYPGEVWLGEMAHQLGWSTAVHAVGGKKT